MNRLSITLLLLFSCIMPSISFAQITKAKLNSFQVDEQHKIILWHVSDFNSIKNRKSIGFTENLKIEIPNDLEWNYNEVYSITNDGSDYKLYLTKLPIIQIGFDENKINSKNKIVGSFSYYESNSYQQSIIGLRHRGNLSLSFNKKSFDLEFWKDSLGKKSRNIQFKNLRSDDDWILDAMFNEPLRIRSAIATNLWNSINTPYYANQEPEAKSGFNIQFVEVFKNHEYYGVYQLSESIDRKQLNLKKNKEAEIRGELFKADSYKGGPSFEKIVEKPIYIDPKWNGWEIKYPVINDEYYWNNLVSFSNLVINSSSQEFKDKIESKINISNAIDYYIFVNLMGATDNMGKNYYLARYDKNEPYFFVPWDLDGVWGVIQDGKPQYFTSKIVLENGLLKRLINENPNNYKQKLKNRWQKLRAKEFSNESLFKEINVLYSKFSDEKIYEREFLIWQNKLNKTANQEHYNHLQNWLQERLVYLDDSFSNL